MVRGTVKLAPGVELPIAPPPTSHGQPPPSVAPCPPVDRSDQRTVAQAPGGGLSPVHLALTGMSAAPPREPRTHELFIDACRLRPTLLGAMRGDTLRITNRSDTALLPALPGDSFMRGLLRGETREVVLKQTQTRVGCSFGSYCGESLIVATTHPFYAVTDGEGHFTIENLPLDQELRLHAWHPLFKVASAQFRLSHDQREKSVELALEPRENAAASSKEQGRAARPGRAKPGAKKAPAMPEPLPRGPAYE